MSNTFSLNKNFIKEFDFESIDHNVNENRIIHLLGYDNNSIPAPVSDSIQHSFQEINKIVHYSGGYKIIDSKLVNIDKKKVIIENDIFDTGKIITFNLKNSETIGIIVATIGDEVSEYIKALLDNGDSLNGYVADQIASEIVEDWVDFIENDLEKFVNQSGYKITNRYSPGYCGWDVSDQHKLFSLLPKNFCGVRLTESSLMIPIKSVSAVIGIGKKVERKEYQCSICDIEFCYKRARYE